MKLKLNAVSGMVSVGAACRIAVLMDASRPIGAPPEVISCPVTA